MKVTFSESVEVLCTKAELQTAMEFLDEGRYKVQTIVYNVMVKGSGRQPGMKILASRYGVGSRVLAGQEEKRTEVGRMPFALTGEEGGGS